MSSPHLAVSSLSADEELVRLLGQVFGHPGFRPGQEAVVRHVASGRDALVVMPTGAGKSLCFQLPGLARPGLVLVVSPLIALMKDQVDQLRRAGVSAAAVVSGMDQEDRRKALSEVRSGAVKFLYVAPERFRGGGFSRWLEGVPIGLLAIDEAHCISRWGHDFRPDYLRLGEVRRELGDPPCVALTATATEEVRGEIGDRLGLREPGVFVTGFDRPGLAIRVTACRGKRERFEHLSRVLAEVGRPALVYAATRRAVEEVAGRIGRGGRAAPFYHAGLAPEDRNRIQDEFLAGRHPVLVATNAFGMGIDLPGLRAVVHWELPGSLEAYYQEIGRAGRDGLHADAVLLFGRGDRRIHEFFLDKAAEEDGDPEASPVSEEQEAAIAARRRADLARLDRMVGFAEAWSCRRRGILDYFGEAPPWERCGTCDVCREGGRPEAPVLAGEDEEKVRKLLACVARMGGGHAISMVARVVTGSSDAAVEAFGFGRLSTFGALSGLTQAMAGELTRSLVAAGCLSQETVEREIRGKTRRYPVVRLTELGARVMRQSEPGFSMRLPWHGAGRVATRTAKARRASSGPVAEVGAVGAADPGSIDAPTDAASEELFQALRTVRRELASAQGVSAFLLGSDKLLRELARIRPRTRERMLEVKGMRDRLFEKSGAAYLEVILRTAPEGQTGT